MKVRGAALSLISTKPILDYQSNRPSSPEVHTRLIELIAQAIHQFAAWVY